MPQRTWLGVLLAALLLAASSPARAEDPGVLRLPWNQWTLHVGDNPQCAEMYAPTCTTRELVRRVDVSPVNQWQRIEVTLPAAMQWSPNLSLLVQGEQPVYEVFVNGVNIGGSGSFQTRRGPEYSRVILNFPTSLARDGKLLIAIHALGLHTTNVVPGFVPTIAPADRIWIVKQLDTLAYIRSSWEHYLFYTALFGAGFVFFLLYSVNTRLIENFWLGVRLCTLFVFRIQEFSSVADLGLPSWFVLAGDRLLNAVAAFITIEFVFAFRGLPVPRGFRWIQAVGALFAASLLLLLPLPASIYYPLAKITEGVYVHHIYIVANLLATLVNLLLVPMCIRSRLPEMRWIGAAVLFITFEESTRQLGFLDLPSFPQDFMWGGMDFDLRPLAYLLFAIVMLVAMTFRLRRIQNRNREVEQEMAAARSVQQILIPDRLPSIPGLWIESSYLPAQEVGGDFFQILPIARRTKPGAEDSDQPSAFIVLGDVSGHGLKAAMTVSMIVGTLRTSAEFCNGPAELLGSLNRRLFGRTEGFATCLALTITPSGKITLANAAHPNPYLNGAEIPSEPNLPLGLSLDVEYSEISIELPPDQRCTLVTDGVVEAARATTRELFGFDRTQAISTKSAASIAEAARNFGAGAPQADDITVLTIARVESFHEAVV